MKYLRNLSIRYKLILISFIPLIALVYYLQINISRDLHEKKLAQQVVSDVSKIQELSKLLHEIQKERALTLSFLSSKGAIGRDDLLEQRETTDNIVSALFIKQKQGAQLTTNIHGIDSLSLVRSKVDEMESLFIIDPYYSNLKASLLDEIASVFRSSQNLELKNRFEEHLFLLYAKDFLAHIRSELGYVFQKGKFEGKEYGSFASLRGKHEINFEKFKDISSPDLKAYFLKRYQGPFVEQTYHIIDAAYNDPSLKSFNASFDNWWSMATNSINLLKDVEDYSSELIREGADAQMKKAQSNMLRNSLIALLVILLILYVVSATINNITRSISSIKEAADKMAKGASNHIVKVNSKDELGNLASSFNRMITTSNEFSEAADRIGKGDYSANINVRGDDDTLGKALHKMKGNLEELSIKNESRNWILSGNGELNNRIRGEKAIHVLAQDVINYLVTYMNAQIGAIYLNTNGKFSLVGSYAFHLRKDNQNVFLPGQGLVGQAALEKKPIIFNHLPSDYILIQSGLGSVAPKSIIVFPFLYEDEVKGVIEIGTGHHFSDLDMEFLNLVGENIAVAFHTAESRTKMKDLLEETQRQAEELEAQQEELKQSNEELHEKTELLERSESELKTQQEELQQTNEELEEKANLLEAQKEKLENAKLDIETKARELESTSRYKSEFLANMSHELRTPLNSILILSQLLVENKNKTLTQKELDFSKNIYNSGTDLLNLINEILDLSKVESGKMELDIAEVSFEQIDSDICSMFSEVAQNKSIDFTIEHKQGLKTISTDVQRLQQVLRNLLSNAFKFTGNGGNVTLEVFNADSTIHFANDKLKYVKDIIAFSVKDNGIGIPKDKLSIVFEAFQQVDGTTKRKYGGTGLGLSISRELANVLGGEIQVQSEEGKGSTFTLYLPAHFDASLMMPLVKPVEIKEQQKNESLLPVIPQPSMPVENEYNDDRHLIQNTDKVILILEDDLEFAQVLLDLVRERNYKGIIATQGNTGLNYVRHYQPDAILLDMNLPIMDGVDVLRHLKNDPQLRHIPVQIISGYDKRKEGLEMGAFDFVRKPVLKEDIQRILDKIEDFNKRKLKKLLVIEDNEQQNIAIRELIGNGDVKSLPAYSGEHGFEMMRKEDFDCVIIDLGLPDMSGFALLEKIKSDDKVKRVPIIVYTGKDLTKEENARLMRLADTVVLKTANSQERLLDETMLFLHRVESQLPKEKQKIIRRLHKSDEILKDKKVLVVDDDIRNIYSLTNVLEEEGINCLTAENGKVAIKMLQENPAIDMILMDVMMPEMDGYEATKIIRSMSRFSKLPILALTAKAMKGDREKCMSAGMSDYIAKPVNIEQLLSLMRVWLYR